jgi:hypothetical protein
MPHRRAPAAAELVLTAPQRPVTVLLDFLEPWLVATVGDAALAPLRARAESLPLDAFRLVGFELPLHAVGAGCDLLLALAPARPLRRQLTHLIRGAGGGPELRRLLAALSDPGDDRFGTVFDAWLEYDVASGDPRRPSLFAAPAGSNAPELARELGAAPAAADGLARFVAQLDADELVQQVGVMHGRGTAQLRCVVKSRGLPAMAALGRVGWRGDIDALADTIGRYGTSLAERSLAVGVAADGTVLAPVGVELHLPGPDDAAALLHRLEADGLAASGTADRLLRWPGHALDHDGTGTPQAFVKLAGLTRGRVVGAVVRRIHHVKLSLAPGRALTAKAYLGAWLTLVGP